MIPLNQLSLMSLSYLHLKPVDRHFAVNVNFMLCPSEGMNKAFSALPPWLLWPSYRSLIVAGFFVLSFPVCYTYIGISRLIILIINVLTGKSLTRNHDCKRIVNYNLNINNVHSVHDKKIR